MTLIRCIQSIGNVSNSMNKTIVNNNNNNNTDNNSINFSNNQTTYVRPPKNICPVNPPDCGYQNDSSDPPPHHVMLM